MIDNRHDTSPNNNQDLESIKDDHNRFKDRVIRLNALACKLTKNNDTEQDMEEADRKCLMGLNALGAKGGLEEMLAAQLLSIHQLQQFSMAMSHKTTDMNYKQYFTNTAIKLANTFVQQANLLARLQGNGGQKIVVEHVDVHQGGQAIVGTINSTTPSGGKK